VSAKLCMYVVPCGFVSARTIFLCVRVNAILPGWVYVQWTRRVLKDNIRPLDFFPLAWLHLVSRTAAISWQLLNQQVHFAASGTLNSIRWSSNVNYLGRTGIPRDLAGVALFLCSSASAHVTGAHIMVDGGHSLNSRLFSLATKL
jgi:NAD(P)-dependent dehydrogenase (short-subunit alcohol dehydrogenase family)